MSLQSIIQSIELMGEEMTQSQLSRTMNAIKADVSEDEIDEIEHAAFIATSPIFSEIRQYRAEMQW